MVCLYIENKNCESLSSNQKLHQLPSSLVPEIQIREQAKKVLRSLENCNLTEAQEIILSCPATLCYNLGKPHFNSLIPSVRFSRAIPRNLDALKMLIETGFQIYSSGKMNNSAELIFYAAAKCDLDTIRWILREDPEVIHETREGDSVLMFMVKYGNIAHSEFVVCVRFLLEAGIDSDRVDYHNQTASSFLSKLHSKAKNSVLADNLKILLDLFKLNRQQKFISEDFKTITQMFKYLIESNEEAFMLLCSQNLQLINADDGSNTLLQFCYERNLKLSANFLIENGANLSQTTFRNKQQPLEIAARRNYQEIFESLLKQDRIVIDERLFETFTQIRGRQMKTKYFDAILSCANLNVSLKTKNGNTPLHYAVLFSNVEASERLLSRNASCKIENEKSKTPFDYMSPEFKEKFDRYIG